MKTSFSTLACPDWSLSRILSIAESSGFDGIELRFVENEDHLWKLPAFLGSGLTSTQQSLADKNLKICCVDTSCRFHFPDRNERMEWIEEGVRMADLAAALEAPGIRIFGDRIQAGATRESTRGWIADSIHDLADRIKNTGVEVWIETHGDFASASETIAILREANTRNAGVIWDPANCLVESGESPKEGAAAMSANIRHVHVKDLIENGHEWSPVLTGEGVMPLGDLQFALRQIKFEGYVSFEWEKKWHPEIPDADIALPHFSNWFRANWSE
jgi:sugar phosphate isomerase/epimerase